MRSCLAVLGFAVLFFASVSCQPVPQERVKAPDLLDNTTPGQICEVHQLPLKSDVVRIDYGLEKFEPEEVKAMREVFPNARSRVLGGCVSDENSKRHAKVSYCPECRKAEAAWRKLNP